MQFLPDLILVHQSLPKSSSNSPDNYQFFRIYHRVYNQTYHFQIKRNDPRFLHTDGKEAAHIRLREEACPPPRAVLLH